MSDTWGPHTWACERCGAELRCYCPDMPDCVLEVGGPNQRRRVYCGVCLGLGRVEINPENGYVAIRIAA
jgi:hypothetical protein